VPTPWRSAEWNLVFRVLPRANRSLAISWWALVASRSLLPGALTVATGALIAAVSAGGRPGWSLAVVAVTSILILVLSPVHDAVSANLGAHAGADLHERLLRAAIEPAGIAHLEEPALAGDFALARDFDLGITAPPIRVCMPFVANGLAEIGSGAACALILFWYQWWAPLVLLTGWLATHRLLRESTVWRSWRSEDVKRSQRHADYAYRMAVDVPVAKELRLFGLGGWTVGRFGSYRKQLLELSLQALRLRERSLALAALAALAANGLVVAALADGALAHRVSLGSFVVFIGAVIGSAVLGIADFDWWFDTAARPAVVVQSLQQQMPEFAELASGSRPAAGLPRREIRLREVMFSYGSGSPVLAGVNLTITAGSSLAIVGQNGAGKTTLAKLLCRLYDPASGAIEVDGVDLRELGAAPGRCRRSRCQRDRLVQVLRRRYRPVRRPVAAGGAGQGDVRGTAGRRAGHTRRADRAPGRAR
jgi:ATP-binding cassette subfamily B protein